MAKMPPKRKNTLSIEPSKSNETNPLATSSASPSSDPSSSSQKRNSTCSISFRGEKVIETLQNKLLELNSELPKEVIERYGRVRTFIRIKYLRDKFKMGRMQQKGSFKTQRSIKKASHFMY